MNPVQTTCPAAPMCFRNSGCTEAEFAVAVFFCKGSNLQVISARIGCGNEKPECRGSKTVSDTF
jgi:hypothetical protein